jgi:hypothetical protein
MSRALRAARAKALAVFKSGAVTRTTAKAAADFIQLMKKMDVRSFVEFKRRVAWPPGV